jgi:O-antigen ligase
MTYTALERHGRRARARIDRRWGALALAILVSAGVIKSSPAMGWLPIDLTFLAAAAVTLALLDAAAGAVHSHDRPPVEWIVGSALFASLGLFQAADGGYVHDKVPGFLVLTLMLSFVAPLFLVRTARQRDALSFGFVGVGVLVAFLAVVAPATSAGLEGRVALFEDATIAPARALGAAIVVILVSAFIRRLPVRYALPVAAALLFVMIRTGARGPAFAVAVALLVAVIVLRGTHRNRAVLLLVGALVVGQRIFSGTVASAQDRFMLLLSDDQGASVSVREMLWRRSWHVIQMTPFGEGWGGMSRALRPIADYPHNVVLEVAGEGGLLALGLLLVAVWVGVRRTTRASRTGDSSATTLLALLVYWLANALVSGDLNDNRGLFLCLAAALMVGSVGPSAAMPQQLGPRDVTAERES